MAKCGSLYPSLRFHQVFSMNRHASVCPISTWDSVFPLAMALLVPWACRVWGHNECGGTSKYHPPPGHHFYLLISWKLRWGHQVSVEENRTFPRTPEVQVDSSMDTEQVSLHNVPFVKSSPACWLNIKDVCCSLKHEHSDLRTLKIGITHPKSDTTHRS